jgi:hypothetical protein
MVRVASGLAGYLTLLSWALCGNCLGQEAAASRGDPAAGGKPVFVRLQKSADGEPLALQVAIVTFRSARARLPRSVDLISAVHVADRAYYAELNRRFRSYDSVLYELVAPEGVRIPEGGGPHRTPISMFQVGLTELLGLEFQLDHIDYTRRNMVHADMTPEEFRKSMQDRGESLLQILFRLVGHSLIEQGRDLGGAKDVQLLAALFSKDREHKLKCLMAEQFVDIEDQMLIYTGGDGSTLVSERNKKALQVLAERWKGGDRHVAIFYGAGHMSDFADRLRADFGLVYDHTDWITAWDLRNKRVSKAADPSR